MASTLILASSSKQRQMLLQGVYPEIKFMPSDFDEAAEAEREPHRRVSTLAEAKAKTVIDRVKDNDVAVLAGDCIGFCRSKLLEKPSNLEEAKQMLQFISGSEIEAVVGMSTWYRNADGKEVHRTELSVSKGYIRHLSQAEITRYVATEPVLTWSAAISPAYPAGAALIAELHGSFTGFVYGYDIVMMQRHLEWAESFGFSFT